MCQMAQIFVQHTHHNPKSTDLTGLDFLVEYDEATAAVSIQDMHGGSFQPRQDANRRKTPSGSSHAGSGTVASRGSRSPSAVSRAISRTLAVRMLSAERPFSYTWCVNRGTPSFSHEQCDHSGSLASYTLFGTDVRRGNPYGRADRGLP